MADDESNLKITILDIQNISQLSRKSGKSKFISLLNNDLLIDNSPANCEKVTIKNDFLFDTLSFCIKKAFTWIDILNTLKFTSSFFSTVIGMKLVEILPLFQMYLIKKGHERYLDIDDTSKKYFSQHFYTTFVVHHRLYSYVYTAEREADRRVNHLEVEVPFISQPFRNAKPLSVWKYEEKVQAIKDDLIAQKQKVEQQNAEYLQKCIDAHKEIMDRLVKEKGPYSKEKQQEMIENLASLKLDILNSELRNQIDTVNLDFNIMFGATVVPRPSVMEKKEETRNINILQSIEESKSPLTSMMAATKI